MAYALGRTLIVDSKNWIYTSEGLEKVFLPLSKTCVTYNESAIISLKDGNKDSEILEISYEITSMGYKSQLLNVLAIPDDIASDLIRLHGKPTAWWISQFASYLFRFQPEMQKIADEAMDKLRFEKPIIGVHIRRSDKLIVEAKFHGLDEYMKHVKDYYDQLEMIEKVHVRRVFIASDDPNVIQEARNKYPNYQFTGNVNQAANLSARYSLSSLHGIVTDIYLLSLSDYIVCTLGSNVCRVAFELMQTKHPDASHRIRSLDWLFAHNEQAPDCYKAIIAHRARNNNEISMNIGDLITVDWETVPDWNGFLTGFNKMSKKSGLFPLFKVIETDKIGDFPHYSIVN